MNIRSSYLMNLLPSKTDVDLCSDHSRQQAALIMLHKCIFKKRFDGDVNFDANQRALELFKLNNEKCANWEPDRSSYYYDIVCDARDNLYKELYSGDLTAPRVSLANAMMHIKPGPGSSIGSKHTDFISKMFDSNLTTYDVNTYKYYVQSLDPSWREAEYLRFTRFGIAHVVGGSRLTFAKKELEISRVINTEASIDMLFQLGLGACMNGVLLDFYNIDMSKQPNINRALARLGSVDGSNATTDLKSASDSISVSFARWYLPPKIFQSLNAVRSKVIGLPQEHGGGELDLNIFSTMGNGFTFPLQTLIFASLVKAVYRSYGLPTDCSEYPHFSVFGDDIICVKQVYHTLHEVLRFCGFTVNDAKSFNSGSFRESCGEDYFRGWNIRSVFVKELSQDAHVYSLFNRLTRWSIRNGVDCSAILRCLRDIPKRDFRVPFDSQDIAGFKVPLFMSNVVNQHVHRYKYLSAKSRTKNIVVDDARLLVAALGGFVDGGSQRSVGLKGRERVSGGLRSNLFPTGYYSTWENYDDCCGDTVFLGRKTTTRPPFTTLRSPSGRPKMVVRRGVTSSWDFIPHQHLTIADFHHALIDVM